MTNKIAIEYLKDMLASAEANIHVPDMAEHAEALDMAIEALRDIWGKANHVVAEIKVDTDEIMERLEQEWYKPNEWIPCSERLPKEYAQYLVCFEDGECYVYWLDDSDWARGLIEKENIIAWMELPEPYKEIEKGGGI